MLRQFTRELSISAYYVHSSLFSAQKETRFNFLSLNDTITNHIRRRTKTVAPFELAFEIHWIYRGECAMKSDFFLF